MNTIARRQFLATTASGLGLSSVLQSLGPLTAKEVQVDAGIARLSDDIEPLVRFLEETPRESVIEQTARKVKEGTSYRQLLAALLLAGVRNVQPRPSVGFKFHAVLVVNSAHLASLSSSDEDRWLPIFWAIDNFKSSQARDVREGNWTLPPVDEAAVPPPHRATAALDEALESWDEQAADVAIAGVVRHFGANQVFDQLARYAARDFRSIGHKVIYLSNGFRTLQTIGWDYAEPVLRSLVYAMLNHTGDPNPATSDLDADRPGKQNWALREKITAQWHNGKPDDAATKDLVRHLHQCSPDEASEMVVQLINAGVSLRSIWDGLFGSAAELLIRQRGIVSLHAVTTTNAIHHAFRATGDESARQYLLLQNAAFLPMFRQAAANRGDVNDFRIDEMTADASEEPASVPEIFETLGRNRRQASEMLYQYLSSNGDPQSIVDHARRLVFLKGDDSHDYKFSSAALEDYRSLSLPWRNRFLAASSYQLKSEGEPTRGLVKRIQEAIAS